MKEIADEYGGLVLGTIAVLGIIAIVAKIMMFGSGPGTLSDYIDAVTSNYL